MKFNVCVCRDIAQIANIEIEASDEKEAENIFYANYSEDIYEDDFHWHNEELSIENISKVKEIGICQIMSEIL